MKFLFTTTTGALLLQTAVLAVEGHYEKLKSTPQHSNDLQRQTQLDRAIASIEGAAASVNISFFAAVAAGPKFTETQIKVQEVAFQLSKLITTFKTSLHSFHITADRVTDALQTAHGYLAEDMEDFAISSLDQTQSQCQKTKKEWEKLTDNFKSIVPQIQKVVASTELEAKEELEREEKIRLEKEKVEKRLSVETEILQNAKAEKRNLSQQLKYNRKQLEVAENATEILVAYKSTDDDSCASYHMLCIITLMSKKVVMYIKVWFPSLHRAESLLENLTPSNKTKKSTKITDRCHSRWFAASIKCFQLRSEKQNLLRSINMQDRRQREANKNVEELAAKNRTMIKPTNNNFYLNKSSAKLKETERLLSDVAQIFQDISVYFNKMEVEMEGLRKNNYGIPKGEEVNGKEKSNKFVAAVGNFFGQWKEFEKSCKNYMDNLISTQDKISQVLKENPTWEEAKLRLSNGKLKP